MLTILQGDVLERLAGIASGSAHCVVTSPPYYGLRDYGTAEWAGGNSDCEHTGIRHKHKAESKQSTSKGSTQDPVSRNCRLCGASRIDKQIGLESTPAEYIAKMVDVFREVRRVLRNDGTLWLNIGDSYARMQENNVPQSKNPNVTPPAGTGRIKNAGMKAKDLCMMPAEVAIALRNDGWYLRSEIVWSKPNPMPESVTDRPTRSHEMVYLLSKSQRYFYDAEAVKESISDASLSRYAYAFTGDPENSGKLSTQAPKGMREIPNGRNGRNRRSVWDIPTQPTPDAHFATFPEALVEPCIMAGTSERGCCKECGAPYTRIVEPTPEYAKLLGRDWSDQEQDDNEGRGHFTLDNGDSAAQRPVKRNAPSVCAEYVTKGWKAGCECNAEIVPCTVFDPFAGSFTTGKVALRLGRKALGIELNPKYIEIANRKCQVTYGLLGATL